MSAFLVVSMSAGIYLLKGYREASSGQAVPFGWRRFWSLSATVNFVIGAIWILYSVTDERGLAAGLADAGPWGTPDYVGRIQGAVLMWVWPFVVGVVSLWVCIRGPLPGAAEPTAAGRP